MSINNPYPPFIVIDRLVTSLVNMLHFHNISSPILANHSLNLNDFPPAGTQTNEGELPPMAYIKLNIVFCCDQLIVHQSGLYR